MSGETSLKNLSGSSKPVLPTPLPKETLGPGGNLAASIIPADSREASVFHSLCLEFIFFNFVLNRMFCKIKIFLSVSQENCYCGSSLISALFILASPKTKVVFRSLSRNEGKVLEFKITDLRGV
jgi:hypothetical protein